MISICHFSIFLGHAEVFGVSTSTDERAACGKSEP